MRRRRKIHPTRRILTCPHCGSARLVYNAGLITGQVYHCLDCDYVGSLVLERDLDEVEGAPLP